MSEEESDNCAPWVTSSLRDAYLFRQYLPGFPELLSTSVLVECLFFALNRP
jgi:hypothetical protein